ncbi:MAG: AAA domain-containing protein [Acholeplasma sp.]|nr:AAA domain-containing protein [Acholeplasma sp.]
MEKALLKTLTELREKLRQEHVNENICSDQALKKMVDLSPYKITDFDAISGLDSEFKEQYGHLFLDAINEYRLLEDKPIKLSKDAYKVLDHYKDRLSNISRSNKNLYLGRIDKSTGIDLVKLDLELLLINFLRSKQKTITLKNLGEYTLRHLTELHRETNKDYKETGTYDLYVGYPFVTGTFKKDDFFIKAPLAYMPVKLNRNKQTFTIEKDQDKDITFNRDLLVTLSKLEKNQLDQDMPFIEDLSHQTIESVLLPYYNKHGLSIKVDELNLLPFESTWMADARKMKKLPFRLKPYCVLGRFKLYSSMIQKDMQKILSANKYNDLLEGLIDEKHLFSKEVPLLTTVSKERLKETDISYVNDLNYSQEKVIEALNKEKKIVIWGPPGTGKSQTITSLIANAVLKGENVLVVSEKKVALDVIYSRLQNQKQYALFIDDATNKQSFYRQLNQIVDQTPPKRTLNNDAYQLEESIQKLSDTLDEALELYYGRKVDGIKVYELFNRYIKEKDIKSKLKPKDILKLFETKLKKPSFAQIKYLETTFDKDDKLKKFMDYQCYLKKYPWFKKLETKVSRSGRLSFNEFLVRLEEAYASYQQKGFFGKRRVKKVFFVKNEKSLTFLATKKSVHHKLLRTLFEQVEFRHYLAKELTKLDKTKTNYLALNKLATSFIDLFLTEPLLKEDHYKLRSYLFDGYYTGFIENFKAKHQKYLYILDDYSKYLDRIEDFMQQKRQVNVESFEMMLYQHALNLSNTKRIMDIKRILESDRKPSIKAFFDHFYMEMTANIKVFLMTPEAISAILPLETQLFDLVIFDEASQLYVEKGIPAIFRAKKVVIAGDPKQLRPSALGVGRIEEEELTDIVESDLNFDAKSLLDLARYRYKETLLNYHYRSRYEELIAFSNFAFYDGKLVVSPNVVKPTTPPIEYVYVKEGVFEQKRNVKEAEAVLKLLKRILKDKEKDESIGIITFNSTQRDTILNLMDEVSYQKGIFQKALEEELFKIDEDGDHSLFVKNIENVQGDERDIIIFSMGYANDETGVLKRRFGWLNHEGGQNRLNVAITRAKKKIYFVSSLYPESFKVDDLAGVGPKLLKDFMRYCYYVSSQNLEMAEKVLLSLGEKASKTDQIHQSQMVKDICQKLEKTDYEIKTNFGIGGFSLDIAILDVRTNVFKLGIICRLDTPINSRLELIHQDKFLKSRGWQIYHVFHSNYYDDPQKELKKIKSLLG